MNPSVKASAQEDIIICSEAKFQETRKCVHANPFRTARFQNSAKLPKLIVSQVVRANRGHHCHLWAEPTELLVGRPTPPMSDHVVAISTHSRVLPSMRNACSLMVACTFPFHCKVQVVSISPLCFLPSFETKHWISIYRPCRQTAGSAANRSSRVRCHSVLIREGANKSPTMDENQRWRQRW